MGKRTNDASGASASSKAFQVIKRQKRGVMQKKISRGWGGDKPSMAITPACKGERKMPNQIKITLPSMVNEPGL